MVVREVRLGLVIVEVMPSMVQAFELVVQGAPGVTGGATLALGQPLSCQQWVAPGEPIPELVRGPEGAVGMLTYAWGQP